MKEQGIGSVEELDQLLSSARDDYNEKHASLKTTEAELKQTNLLIKNTGQYLANKDTYRQYMKSENKADFREKHIAEITLYEAARKFLKEAGYLQKPTKAKTDSSSGSGTIYLPQMKELRSHKQDLVTLKNHQYDSYSYVRAKYRELQTVHQNVHEMLTLGNKEKTKTTDKNQSLLG